MYGLGGGRHLDRPVAFYKLSWLENKRGEGEGGGKRWVAEREENEEGNRINAQSCHALNTVVFTSLL